MCLAIPGKLLRITDTGALTRSGKVSFGGIVKDVNLACVPEACAGDYVLAHVGLAIAVIDPVEAARVFAHLEEMGDLAELGEGGER